MNKTIVAIDPGASGGIAIQEGAGEPYASAMPTSDGDIVDALITVFQRARQESRPVVVLLEQMIKYAGKNCPASSIAVYARNVGFIQGVVQASGVRLEMVWPKDWQAALHLGTARDASRSQWKAKLKGEAQRLFPNAKPTLKTADALLMLEYGRRTAL